MILLKKLTNFALGISDPLMDQGDQVDQGDQSGTSITTEQGVSWDQKYVFCTFKNTKRRRTIFLIFNKIIENIPSQPFVLMGLDFKSPAMWWTMNNVLKYLMKLVSWPAGAGIKQGNLFGWREFGMLARNTHTWWSLFLFF